MRKKCAETALQAFRIDGFPDFLWRSHAESRVLFVDDGSKDATWNIIESFEDPRFEGAKLAHNAGHQNALWAGMTLACDQCDAVISIDADLQDDPGSHSWLSGRLPRGL